MGLFDGRSKGTFSRFVPNKALRAAAAASTKDTVKQLQTLQNDRQRMAFGYYAKLGECWNPTQFYARSMAKLSVAMGERDPATGEITPTEDPLALGLFEPIQHAFTGEGGLGASYGRLKFLVGEGNQCQSRPPESIDADSASKPPVWEFLSTAELSVKDEGRTIVRQASGSGLGVEYQNVSDDPEAGEPQPGQMRMWRFWRKDPQYSFLADSPVFAVLDLYEQLSWVTMGERADIQNRIANAGLLLIPREIDLEVTSAEQEALGEDPEADPFMVRVAELMMAAIGDPGSSGASVPGVIRAPAELLHPDKFRHLKFYDPTSSMFASQREEALTRRIGIGLDLPLEEITGLSQANHWTAWKIDDEKWAHIQPVAQSWCDDVWNAIMRPLLIANNVQDPDRFLVMYDNTDLVTDPDKGKTALLLHKDGILKAVKTLEVNGFDPEEDLMDGDEHDEWLAIQMRSLELLGIEPPAPVVVAPPEPVPAPEDQPASEEEPQAENGGPAAAEAAELRGIAEFAVDRAREMAGAKVRGLRRRCEECFTGLDDVPNRQIIAALGKEKLERIGAPEPGVLVNGIVQSFLFTCERMGHKVTPSLADLVQRHASLTLFDKNSPPLPDDVMTLLTGWP